MHVKKTTGIHVAAMGGDAAAITRLAKVGEDPNQLDNYGISPLVLALERDHFPAAEALVRAGADVNGNDGHSVPLNRMLARHKTKAAQWLLDQGADPTRYSDGRINGLHWAAWQHHSEVVRRLVAAKLNLNQQSKLGDTPLHFALQDAFVGGKKGEQALETVRILLEAGADPNLRRSGGGTPMDYVPSTYNAGEPHGIYDLLRKHGAKYSRELRSWSPAVKLEIYPKS